jgi:hypothetical protein
MNDGKDLLSVLILLLSCLSIIGIYFPPTCLIEEEAVSEFLLLSQVGWFGAFQPLPPTDDFPSSSKTAV